MFCAGQGIGSMMTKLTVKEKLGYGSASLGDALAYSASGTFLMFFLTTVAGIGPGAAGAITAAGSVWNAAVNPVIGHYANLVRTRWGRRRPLMFVFSLVLALAFFLLFTNVPMRASLKPFYYGFMLMLYWTGYTGFFVPYLALGADYTSNYDERTTLRLYASVFNMMGAMISMVLPTMFVSFLEDVGLSAGAAWSAAGLTLGLLSAGSIMVTVIACRFKDPPCVTDESKARPSAAFHPVKILSEYISVFRLRPARYLVAASVLSLTGYAMLIAGMMYFFTYDLGLNSSGSSALLLVRAAAGAAAIPFTGMIARRIDKKWTLVLAYLSGIALLTILRFTGVAGVAEMLLFTLGVMLLTSIYWQLVPSMYYDICEYDLLETGLERQATIVSLQGLVEAVAIGLGSLLLGLILGAAGFADDAPAQSETALAWIFNCTTLIPAMFYIAAAVVLAKHPLGRKEYQDVLDRLGKR